ncbi:MAG TPA: phosphatidate cytidylyltransferase [Candidatus Acidoferrales bacterium]|nr:phosphatidate cytidylyltransferase [Candidatus Acidoferrales bacterium]
MSTSPEPGPELAGARAPAKSGSWSLGLRIASGLLFVPLLLLLANAGGVPFLAFVAMQTIAGLVEFYRMMRAKGYRPEVWLGHASALGVLVLAYRPHTPHAAFFATAALLLLLALALRHPERRGIVENMSVTVFGVLYVGWLSAHFVLLRELPWRAGLDYADGARLVLYAFLVTWSCDTGAYAVGRWLGRTRPWTTISPRKTLEGSIGGFAFALLGAWVGSVWFMHSRAGQPWLRPIDVLAIGALVGVCGQVGDLVESLLKRDAASGDSSDLIPGHGGMLDRFDSLYFGAPILYYYLKIVVFQIP